MDKKIFTLLTLTVICFLSIFSYITRDIKKQKSNIDYFEVNYNQRTVTKPNTEPLAAEKMVTLTSSTDNSNSQHVQDSEIQKVTREPSNIKEPTDDKKIAYGLLLQRMVYCETEVSLCKLCYEPNFPNQKDKICSYEKLRSKIDYLDQLSREVKDQIPLDELSQSDEGRDQLITIMDQKIKEFEKANPSMVQEDQYLMYQKLNLSKCFTEQNNCHNPPESVNSDDPEVLRYFSK